MALRALAWMGWIGATLSGCAMFVCASTSSAYAQPTWGIDRFPARDVGTGEVETFRDLLQSEISQRNGVTFVDLGVMCPDSACTIQAARQAGQRYAVHASLGRLGHKVVVSFASVDAALGKVLIADTMSVNGVEELDTLAKRIASTLVEGKPVEETARLGEITSEEARAPIRRDTRIAFSLGPEALFPLAGYAEEQLGVGIGLGLWFETLDFAIEPRLTYRRELTGDREHYDHVAFDIALDYLFTRDDVSPLLGLGLGIHYLDEEIQVERRVGTLFPSISRDKIDDELMGFSTFLRAGVLLMRTYDVSTMLALDYVLTLADFQERSNEQALRLSLVVIIGGT